MHWEMHLGITTLTRTCTNPWRYQCKNRLTLRRRCMKRTGLWKQCRVKGWNWIQRYTAPAVFFFISSVHTYKQFKHFLPPRLSSKVDLSEVSGSHLLVFFFYHAATTASAAVAPAWTEHTSTYSSLHSHCSRGCCNLFTTALVVDACAG